MALITIIIYAQFLFKTFGNTAQILISIQLHFNRTIKMNHSAGTHCLITLCKLLAPEIGSEPGCRLAG